MRLNAGRVGVVVRLGSSHRRQLIQLSIRASSLRIEHALLSESSLLDTLLLTNRVHLSLSDETLLQLSRLGIEAIKVAPFLFELGALIPDHAEGAKEGQRLELADVRAGHEELRSVDERDVSELEACRESAQSEHAVLISCEGLVLESILILETMLTSVEVPQVVEILMGVGHDKILF